MNGPPTISGPANHCQPYGNGAATSCQPYGNQLTTSCQPCDNQVATNCQSDDNQVATNCQPCDNQPETSCQPDDNQLATQVRLGKLRTGKVRSGEVNPGEGKTGGGGGIARAGATREASAGEETPALKEPGRKQPGLDAHAVGAAEDGETAATAADRLIAYAANNLTYLSPNNAQELDSFRDSLTDDMILWAIDQACAAGSRTYRYARAILRRMVDSGFRTLGEVRAAEAQRQKAREKNAANRDAACRGNTVGPPEPVGTGDIVL